jgi:hypothetical protein
MRPPFYIAIVCLVFTACCVTPTGASLAGGKGRGGGGKGGGGFGGGGFGGGAAHTAQNFGPGKPTSNRAFAGGSPRDTQLGGSGTTHKPKQAIARDTRGPDRTQNGRANRLATGNGAIADSDHPWSMQRTNEERKLEHRLGVADKLDRLADANGNQHLHDTAERMRQKAHQQYDKRIAKIDSKSPLDSPDDLESPAPADPDEPIAGPPTTGEPPPPSNEGAPPTQAAPTKLTGRQNALARQLHNEERKLEERTELAERLRAMGEEQGDPELLQAADRIEQQALSHFEERMQAIRSLPAWSTDTYNRRLDRVSVILMCHADHPGYLQPEANLFRTEPKVV